MTKAIIIFAILLSSVCAYAAGQPDDHWCADGCFTHEVRHAEKIIFHKIIALDSKTETVCFGNYIGGDPLLGSIAKKYGACNGRAAMVRAFRQNATFVCLGRQADARQANYLAERVLKLHRNSCEKKVRLEGYCSLREFCRAHAEVLARLAVRENAVLTFTKTFFYIRQWLGAASDKEVEATTLLSLTRIKRDLAEGLPAMVGRAPGKQFLGHVLLAVGLTELLRADGGRIVYLRLVEADRPDGDEDELRVIRINPAGHLEKDARGRVLPIIHLSPLPWPQGARKTQYAE